ncbi:phospholipase D Hl-PLD1-like [Centruroides sculpturatus]|uniref:phospholipase D Hl-PLD1-like n=1 Tax=Centruroides sculpturatus TaxID=218467 RepID=UPI000C6DE29D|nr:phospholipase D Hl-PLD1-like [Centruroides sculpturatus]
MIYRWLFSIFALFIQIFANYAEVIPIWNIGHMVNALWQIDQFLDLGANAIEADFSFDKYGNAEWTYHGYPCDCFRSCKKYAAVEDYLSYIRELTDPTSPKFRKNFVLLMIDNKISGMNDKLKYKAGSDVAEKIIRYLWSGSGNSKLWILLSFPYTTDIDFVVGFKDTLKKMGYNHMDYKIGWDISGNEGLEVIRKTYEKLNITGSIWQGDGITNCLPRSSKRLLEVLKKRDSHIEWDSLNKVYYWTLDKWSTMRYSLRVGVDGIITNYPHRFVYVLSEKEFSSTHRLATIEDNPWRKIHRTKKVEYSDRTILECEYSLLDEESYYSGMVRYYKTIRPLFISNKSSRN